MLEQWWSDHCPNCKALNFVCNGDPSDMTAMDIQGIRCWQCGHCWSLDQEFEEEMAEDDDPYYDDGRHFEEVKHEKNT